MNAFDPAVRDWLERILDPEAERDAILVELEGQDPELRALVHRALSLGEGEPAETPTLDTPTVVANVSTDVMAAHRFPGYVIVEELRPGGMSLVYRARHESDPARRDVAIKVVNTVQPEILERFDKEVAILRKLDHPQIARLLDDGTLPDGRPFLVMEHIEGQPIGDHAESLPVDDVVALVRRLCEPLAYCHQRGVWHRDIKPSNVIVRSDGVPILIDFGIAKAESALLHVTATMNRAMTYLYAAPEQAHGHCTNATDTYSLGMLLYQLLAGRVAYEAATHMEWADAMLSADPTPLADALDSVGRAPVPEKLARIVDKAVRKEPERRYATALDLSADLESYLAGNEVTAKKDDPIYLARRAVRRHRALLAIVLAWALAATALVVLVSRERDAAEAARHDAEVAKHNSDVVIATLNQALHLAEKVPGYLEEIPITKMVDTTELTRQQLTGEPAARAQLAITVGVVQRDLARYDEAIEVLQEAIPNLDDELAVQARTELGGTFHRAGKFGEAEPLLMETLAACLNLGIACPATLNELALVQADKKGGSLELAEATMRRALAAANIVGNPWEAAEAKTNLGKVAAILGRYDEAILLAEEALSLRQSMLPEDHLMVAEAYNNAGTATGRAGDYEASERYLRRGYEIREAKLGPHHPWVLESLNNLAQCLRRLGRNEEAERAFKTAIAGYDEFFPNHRNRPGAAQNLGLLLIDLEKFAEAEKLLEDILQLRLESGNERKIGTAYVALGKLRLEQGQAKRMEANTHFTEAEPLLVGAYGEEHVKVQEVRALRALANYYKDDSTEVSVCDADATLRSVAPNDLAVTSHTARLDRHGFDCR